MEVRSHAPGELERGFMKGGGFSVDQTQFPFCPDKRCRHGFLDQPPGNKTVDEDATAGIDVYRQLCNEFKLWKRNLGPQPRDPSTGKLLEKMPTAPKPRKKYLRCHCSQEFADPRKGKKCPVDCKFGGVTFAVGKCPICQCSCKAYVPMDAYRTIMIVHKMPKRRDRIK